MFIGFGNFKSKFLHAAHKKKLNLSQPIAYW